MQAIADSMSVCPAILINHSRSDYEIRIYAKLLIVLNISFEGNLKKYSSITGNCKTKKHRSASCDVTNDELDIPEFFNL